jgi:hypothetical protein
MLDLSDHQIATISMWAEIAILVFMVWEKYGAAWGIGHLTPPLAIFAHGSVWRFLWENRTLLVAILGLGFISWLYLWRGVPQPSNSEKETATIRTELEASQHQVALLQSQLESVKQKLGEADIVSGTSRTLYLALEDKFKAASAQHFSMAYEIRKIDTESRHIAQIRVPSCQIVIFSALPPQQIAKIIKLAADSQDCAATIAGEPAPPQLPIVSDAPPNSPILSPPHIVIHYPAPEDALNLPERFISAMYRPDPIFNAKGAAILDQLANDLASALRNCDSDTQRHKKIDENPTLQVDKWTIYIDLGKFQTCQ